MISPRSLAQIVFHRSGLLRVVRHRNRKCLRILMYHRFPDADTAAFDRQCRHIQDHYHALSLSEAGRLLKSGSALPDNALVITVDDGYEDFYRNAFPALRQHGIPATVFLTTGFLDGLTWLWWDRVRVALERTPAKDSFDSTVEALTRVPNQERLRTIESMAQGVDATPPTLYVPLRWDQAREMSKHGIDFGAHTVMHPILSRIETEGELRWEIEQSRDRIAQELGTRTLHFCYPSGRPEDLDGRTRQLVEAAGFETAVTTEPGFNSPGADLLLMRRIGVEPGNTPHYFKQQLAGFRVPQ